MVISYNRLGLLKEATRRYVLGDPLHGPHHWLAVEDAAVELAAELGGDVEVASIFGILHDCRRESSDRDPEHGPRAAELAVELRGRLFDLPNVRMQKLVDALYWHDTGLVVKDVDIMCCWAADRLQLTRVGITPERSYFCDRTWPVVQRMLEMRQMAA